MRVLRDAMRRNSGRIWHEKAWAERHDLSMSEETITEMLLLRLLRAAKGSSFQIDVFNKIEEVTSGADWEFWFLGLLNHVVLRIQAKRLFRTGRYASLDPQGGQTTQLIKDATKWGSHPYFAFYNDETFFPQSFPVRRCCEYHGPSYCGCLLVPAMEVLKLGSKNPTHFSRVALPLHCIVCGQQGSLNSDLASTVANNLGIDIRSGFMGAEQTFRLTDYIGKDPEDVDGHCKYLQERNLAGVALIQQSSELE
jgi:hypothetical protein